MSQEDDQIPEIDWSAFGAVSTTCLCRCGEEFRSRAKAVKIGERFCLVTQEPCPRCGHRDNCQAAYGDPEVWTIRG